MLVGGVGANGLVGQLKGCGRHARHRAVTAMLARRADRRQHPAGERRRRQCRLKDADDRMDRIASVAAVLLHRLADGLVEVVAGRGQAVDVDSRRQPRGGVGVDQVAVAGVHAREDGAQLVHRCHRAEQSGEIELEGSHALGEPVGQEVERVDGSSVGRAERDERPRDLPPVVQLEEGPRHEPAHRVAEQHELRVVVAGAGLPCVEPAGSALSEATGGDTVVPAPVVREVEPVLAGRELEPLQEHLADLRVPVDLPEARHKVDVGHEAWRGHSVTQVGLVDVVDAAHLEALHAAARARGSREAAHPSMVPTHPCRRPGARCRGSRAAARRCLPSPAGCLSSFCPPSTAYDHVVRERQVVGLAQPVCRSPARSAAAGKQRRAVEADRAVHRPAQRPPCLVDEGVDVSRVGVHRAVAAGDGDELGQARVGLVGAAHPYHDVQGAARPGRRRAPAPTAPSGRLRPVARAARCGPAPYRRRRSRRRRRRGRRAARPPLKSAGSRARPGRPA